MKTNWTETIQKEQKAGSVQEKQQWSRHPETARHPKSPRTETLYSDELDARNYSVNTHAYRDAQQQQQKRKHEHKLAET